MLKKEKLFFLLAILFAGLALSECQKYPDDDVIIQFKRPFRRLIKYGPWVLDKLTVDGVDKTSEFQADSASFKNISFWGKPGSDANFTIFETNGADYAYGVYDFSDGKTKIKMSARTVNSAPLAHYGPLFTFDFTEWEILRLSRKGLTFKTTYNSSEYILTMVPER